MKKFKDYFRAMTSPHTPEEWLQLVFAQAELYSVPDSYQGVRDAALYDRMIKYLRDSPEYTEVFSSTPNRHKFLNTKMKRIVVIKLKGDSPTSSIVTNLHWYHA